MRNTEEGKRAPKIARIRREIEILLHSPLHEEEWENLVEEHYVEELLEDTLTTREVADKVRRRRQVYGQRGAKRGNASPLLSEQKAKESSGRLKALSILVAEEATRRSRYRHFVQRSLALSFCL